MKKISLKAIFGSILYFISTHSMMTLGWFLLIFGLITAPIPLPIGQFIALIGLSILVSRSPRIQRGVQKLRRKFKPLDKGTAYLGKMRYCPIFIQDVIQKTDPAHLDVEY
jgi:hypothetical protein